MIPPPLWNARDCVLQVNYTTAHIHGKINTTPDFLSPFLEISEKVPTEPMDVNVEATGTAQGDQVFFLTDDVELLFEEQLWQLEPEKSNTVQTESPVWTVSHCYKIDKYTNTLAYNMEPINKIPCILIGQDADPVLPNFRRQWFGYLSMHES